MTLSLSEIGRRLQLPMEGPDVPSLRPALMDDAGPGCITLVTSERYEDRARERGVSAVITPPDVETPLPALLTPKPRVAFAHLLAVFDDRPVPPPGIHPTALVAATARIDQSASVGPFSIIEDDVVIGPGTRLVAQVSVGVGTRIGGQTTIGPGVRIYHRCEIGNRVQVQAGTVIGSEGFGYEWDGTRHVAVPHIGTVIIEDEVDVGANCCIDRGKTGATLIERGTKLDNLVQIGHGVRVGPYCLLAGQTGVGGSAFLGTGAVLGGQAGVTDHTTVGPGAILAAQTGAVADVSGGKTWMGTPAREVPEMRRILAAMTRLPELISRVRALERQGKGQRTEE